MTATVEAYDVASVIVELRRSLGRVEGITHAAVHCDDDLFEHVVTVADHHLVNLIEFCEAEHRESGPAGHLAIETQAVIAAVHALALVLTKGKGIEGALAAGEYAAALDLLPGIMLERIDAVLKAGLPAAEDDQ